jgi:hypothetical protein
MERFEEFLNERNYLSNVSHKTLVYYNCAFHPRPMMAAISPGKSWQRLARAEAYIPDACRGSDSGANHRPRTVVDLDSLLLPSCHDPSEPAHD